MDIIIEVLADFCHKQWSNWTSYLFSKCTENENGTLTIPTEYVNRWTRQILTDYDDLSESEKDSDRHEARKIIRVLNITVSDK